MLGPEFNTVYIAPVMVWKCSKPQEIHTQFGCIVRCDEQKLKEEIEEKIFNHQDFSFPFQK